LGKQRMLAFALSTCAVGALVAALSTSIAVLIGGRILQSFAAATYPLAFGIVRDELHHDQVSTGIGLVSATWGMGGCAGFAVAGPVVARFGHAGLFWLVFCTTIAALVAVVRYVPASPNRQHVRVDWVGAALLGAGLGALLLGVSESG